MHTIHASCCRMTMGRMSRAQRECMHPKLAKDLIHFHDSHGVAQGGVVEEMAQGSPQDEDV